MRPDPKYHELCAYTLALRDPEFIHQHVVDTYALQHADASTKPIGVTFSLAGLYLHNERQFTGRQVQLAHMAMARAKRAWPAFVLPTDRGSMTVADVIAAPAGPERKRAIHAWCASVWNAFRENENAIASLLREYGI